MAGQLREHVIDPHTKVKKGTFGKKAEKIRDEKIKYNPKVPRRLHKEGYILYNKKTNVAAFYDENRRLVTYLIPNDRQADDIRFNSNLL